MSIIIMLWQHHWIISIMEDCSHIKYETDNLHNSSRREIVVTIQNKFLFQKKKTTDTGKGIGNCY